MAGCRPPTQPACLFNKLFLPLEGEPGRRSGWPNVSEVGRGDAQLSSSSRFRLGSITPSAYTLSRSGTFPLKGKEDFVSP
jgi:hypothetical protein